MIKAAFRRDGEVWPCAVNRAWLLRDVQRMLCEQFHAPFPAMKAVLKYGDVIYDEFSDKPFQNCLESATFELDFIETDDPYFYDKADRCRLKVKLEEEVEYDEAVSSGVAPVSDLETWVRGRRTKPVALSEVTNIF